MNLTGIYSINPVRAGIREWLWSSYKETAGSGKHSREFVRAGLKEEAPWKEIKGQIYLGDENFIDRIKKLITDKETLKEIPRIQRYITRPSLEDIFKHKDKRLYGKTVYEAHIRYGYTLKDIAKVPWCAL